MKGVVFTGFLELVEEKFGDEMVDKLLGSLELESEGAYTAVGTYDHGELFKLVGKLSEYTGVEVPVLVKTFAKFFGKQHLRKYEAFYKNTKDTFSFLESIDSHIHIEVKKLYPDAELPRFSTKRIDDTTIEMIYTSSRKLATFAEGLIEDTADYYNEKVEIEQELLLADGSEVKFTIRLV